MSKPASNPLCVVFDLDDTIYKEIDFLRSAYQFISKLICNDSTAANKLANEMYQCYCNKQDAFGLLLQRFPNLSIQQLLEWYRYHHPVIAMSSDAVQLLERLKRNQTIIGLITDGRSITQRNKIAALRLSTFISSKEAIVISEEFGSEKPTEANYLYLEQLYPSCVYVYIADNPKKDFVAPNKLGWKTIGLRNDGRNIHPQTAVPTEYQPQIWINSLSEVIDILQLG